MQYPESEVRELADGDGLVRATCEFCSTVYTFSPADVRAGQATQV
jgi:redox-regulated HSP33 family molecular chaperone